MSANSWYTVTPATESADYTKGLGTLTYTNGGDVDLMYNALKVEAKESNDPVEFKFQHLLSKVKISFVNNVDPYVKLKITGLSFSFPKKGTINLCQQSSNTNTIGEGESGNAKPTYSWDVEDDNSDDWTQVSGINLSQSIDVNSNTLTTEDFFLLPCETSYNINFTVDVVMDGVQYDNGDYKNLRTASLQATVSNVSLEMGSAYNFVATITPGVITGTEALSFEIQHIPDWNGIKDGETTVQVFTDVEKLKIAAKLGGQVTLGGNATISSTIDVASDLTINLNGKTITYDMDDANNVENTGEINCLFNVIGGATLTITSTNELGKHVDGSSIISLENTAIGVANESGKIEIKGGSHQSITSNIYIIDTQTGGEIQVSAGSFYNWDPSAVNSATEKNYLADLKHTNNEYYSITTKIDELKGGTWYNIQKRFNVSTNSDLTLGTGDPDVDYITINNNLNLDTQKQFTDRGDITIDMSDLTKNNIAFTGYGFVSTGETHLTIKNAYLKTYLAATGNSKLTLENCTIDISGLTVKGGRYCVYATGSIRTEVTLINCKLIINEKGSNASGTISNILQAYSYGSSNNVVINIINCEYGGYQKNLAGKPFYGSEQVIITSGTFKFKPSDFGAIIAEGSTETESGNSWIVSVTQ